MIGNLAVGKYPCRAGLSRRPALRHGGCDNQLAAGRFQRQAAARTLGIRMMLNFLCQSHIEFCAGV
jgi:hypothetical protein